MDLLALAVVIAALLLIVVLLLRLRYPRVARCPACGKATVPGYSTCPFCRTAYRRPPSQPSPRTPSPTPIPANPPKLICIQGPTAGQENPITANEFTIGRSAQSMLRLDGELVSRRHAHISLRDARFVLYDCDSTNGTYVNGQRIAQHVLRPGDQIQIGPCVFAFRAGEDAPARAPIPSPPPQEAPPRIPSPPPHVVGSLNEYELTPIREGGMATIYRARSRLDPASTVAIKVFHHSDPYLRNKFEQEGRIIGPMLRHPHIARIYSYGTDNGRLYIVMEFVDAGSLRDRLIPGQSMPLDQVIVIVGQTCEALNHAHTQGIIHRDIKPENILFSSQEGIKLVDFGIARSTQERTQTSAGMIVGTPYYMSYEQAKGLRVDGRSDLYSLGVVMYEMVTGQLPFVGEPLDVIRKHVKQAPVPPRRLNRDLPTEVERVVLRTLEKDRDRRFQTAAELAAALGYRVSAPSPLPSWVAQRPAGPVPSAVRQRGRRQPEATGEPHLVMLTGSRRGKAIVLAPGATMLSRGVVDPGDLWISRGGHARVLWQGDHFWVEDLGSLNGTYLNSRRVFGATPVQPGDQIQVGQTVLHFVR